MRKWSYLKPDIHFGGQAFQKIMVYEDAEGAWVFLYDTKDALFCAEDLFYEDLESALDEWEDKIDVEGWRVISDPLTDCQHDCILPVRVKGRDLGIPQWGKYEILKNGIWEDLS